MHGIARITTVTLAALLALAGCGRDGSREHADTMHARPDSGAATTAPAATKTGFVEVNGGKQYYAIHGDLAGGRVPLVVLHGSLMSADAMAPLVERFARGRPVIALDARGHGRSPDIPGPISYDLLADDVAGVLAALGVAKADLLGYSMGGTTAIVTALRHPERVNRIVSISGPYSRDGWYPELRKGFAEWKPGMLAGTGLEAEYRRLAPAPAALDTLILKLRDMESQPYAWPEARIRALAQPTMVIVGDADGEQLSHAIRLFELRGGGDRQAAVQGYLAKSPPARLAILPATSHVGMMARPQLIVDVVTPFLDDEVPPLPDDFLKPGKGTVPPAEGGH